MESQRDLRGGSPGPGWIGVGVGARSSAKMQPQRITGARKGMLDALVAYLAHLSSKDTILGAASRHSAPTRRVDVWHFI